MFPILGFLKFQFYYWKLYRDYYDDEKDEWVLNQEALRIIALCFQNIPESHLSRLNRRYLQTIQVSVFESKLADWNTRAGTALGYLKSGQFFPSSWGYPAQTQSVSIAFYFSDNYHWKNPTVNIMSIWSTLDEIFNHLDQYDGAQYTSRLRFVGKMIQDGVGVLVELLNCYKEHQFEYRKKKRVKDQ